MSGGTGSRAAVLERIRAATRNSAAVKENGAPAHAEPASEYIRCGNLTVKSRQELFIERLREYDAEVVECEPAELAAAIQAQLAASGRRTFVVPEGVPAEWRAAGFEWKVDGDLPVDEIERADGVVTACFCGVAESGTIVLHHSETEGRRVLSLLPDWHLCVVRASQIVQTLPEYFDRCAIRDQGSGVRGQNTEGAREQGSGPLPGLVTWISGPSATADIEMTRIKGVHGPRYLNVIVVNE
jgi:L-lactate dehydrogenase complex protein LldG